MLRTSVWRRSGCKGSQCPQPPSGEEADAMDLNAKNWEAFVIINNLNILNLHAEKKQMQRISMLRTGMPLSSLTTSTSST